MYSIFHQSILTVILNLKYIQGICIKNWIILPHTQKRRAREILTINDAMPPWWMNKKALLLLWSTISVIALKQCNLTETGYITWTFLYISHRFDRLTDLYEPRAIQGSLWIAHQLAIFDKPTAAIVKFCLVSSKTKLKL